jgi:sugar phosphate isomerase/epimerase
MHPTTTRRGFLGQAAAFVSVAASSSLRGAPPARKTLVGAHPWVYAAKLPGFDFTPRLPEIFADFRAAGFDAIELMHVALRHDDAVARIRELSRRHSLPVLGTSFSGAMWDRAQHAQILESGRTAMTRLAALGGRTFGASVGALRGFPPKTRKTEGQLDAQAECLRELMAFGKELGIVVNLHNHTYEVENELDDLKGTLARIPEARLGPDLNWLIRGGVDPVDFIRRYGRQIVFLHLRDQAADGRWVEGMGDGATDFAAIAQALRDVNFSGDAVIELAHETDFAPTRPLGETWRRSRDFVRERMGF